jgi:hypothetical protein
VLAFFDDDVFRPEFMDFFQRGDDVGFLGEEVSFAVVQNKSIDSL